MKTQITIARAHKQFSTPVFSMTQQYNICLYFYTVTELKTLGYVSYLATAKLRRTIKALIGWLGKNVRLTDPIKYPNI